MPRIASQSRLQPSNLDPLNVAEWRHVTRGVTFDKPNKINNLRQNKGWGIPPVSDMTNGGRPPLFGPSYERGRPAAVDLARAADAYSPLRGFGGGVLGAGGPGAIGVPQHFRETNMKAI